MILIVNLLIECQSVNLSKYPLALWTVRLQICDCLAVSLAYEVGV